jgi:hypothetical protein
MAQASVIEGSAFAKEIGAAHFVAQRLLLVLLPQGCTF